MIYHLRLKITYTKLLSSMHYNTSENMSWLMIDDSRSK